MSNMDELAGYVPSAVKRGCSVDGCPKPHDSKGFCGAHYWRWKKHGHPLAGGTSPYSFSTFEEVMEALVDKSKGCWEWNGRRVGGYGRIRFKAGAFVAHRWVYEHLVGPIPQGLQLDHLCRFTYCVNPEHLEPVTGQVNTLRCPNAPASINARKTECIHGHPFSGPNLIVYPNGKRACRTCRQIRDRARRNAS